MVRLSFPDLLIFHQHATAVSPRSHGHSDGELTFGSHANIQCQSPEPIQSSHVVLESCQTISSNNAIKCNKNNKKTQLSPEVPSHVRTLGFNSQLPGLLASYCFLTNLSSIFKYQVTMLIFMNLRVSCSDLSAYDQPQLPRTQP